MPNELHPLFLRSYIKYDRTQLMV